MGLLGLLGLLLILVGVWQLLTGAIIFGIILIIVGLFLASSSGGRLTL